MLFIDKYKWLNIFKNCEKFLKKIEKLKPYLIKFNIDNIIKKKLINYLWS